MLLRYVRLYICFVRFSVSKSLEFRIDFFFSILMDLLFYALNLYFYYLILKQTPHLGGWTREQVYVFVSAFLLSDAIMMTVLQRNLWYLPLLVNRGDLDYYLIRPVSSLFFLSLREIAVNSSINLVMSLAIMGWALHGYVQSCDHSFVALVLRIPLFFLLVLLGTFLMYSVRLLFLLPVFWTQSGRGFDMVHWSFMKLAERPDGIYRGWFRWVLLTIFPFAVANSIPARALFDRNPLWPTLNVLGCCALFSFLSFLLWRKCLRIYSSASS